MQTNKQPYSNNVSNMFLLIVIISFVVGVMAKCGNQPVNVAYFKHGQILLPDYACSDTLIVIDAIGLNKGMALIDGSDYSIDSLLHTHCVIK